MLGMKGRLEIDDDALDRDIAELAAHSEAPPPPVTHLMEHGLLMLAGQGIYHLDAASPASKPTDHAITGPAQVPFQDTTVPFHLTASAYSADAPPSGQSEDSFRHPRPPLDAPAMTNGQSPSPVRASHRTFRPIHRTFRAIATSIRQPKSSFPAPHFASRPIANLRWLQHRLFRSAPALECGDSSPLSRRRLVAVERPRAPAGRPVGRQRKR